MVVISVGAERKCGKYMARRATNIRRILYVDETRNKKAKENPSTEEGMVNFREWKGYM